MNLREFKFLLRLHSDKQFRLQLPNGLPVPLSFHVTEVGRVQKTFLDCGGTLREQTSCQLQIWIGGDDEHRLEAGKTAAILEKARTFLPDEMVPVEIEYEDPVISQYTVEGHEVADGAVVLKLEHKHTDCLAKELCGVPATSDRNSKGIFAAATPCCGPSGCC